MGNCYYILTVLNTTLIYKNQQAEINNNKTHKRQ